MENSYTEKKIEAICQVLGFGQPKIDRFLWKGDRDLMLEVEMRKL